MPRPPAWLLGAAAAAAGAVAVVLVAAGSGRDAPPRPPGPPLAAGAVLRVLGADPQVSPSCRGLVRAGRLGDRAGIHSRWLDIDLDGDGDAERVPWSPVDLTGDRRAETIVRVFGGAGDPGCLYVLSRDGGRLRVVRAVDDRRGPYGRALPALALDDGALVERVPAPGQDVRRPDRVIARRLGWNGRALVVRGRRAVGARPADAAPVRARDARGRVVPASRRRPLRLLFAGDSISTGPAFALAGMVRSSGAVSADLDNRGSTGLVRPDFFDWPRGLRADIAAHRPHVVLFMVGANDVQALRVGGRAWRPGTPAWRREYRRRVAQVMRLATRDGRRLLWVGMPPMGRSAGYARAVAGMNRIAAAEARAWPRVDYVRSAASLPPAGGRAGRGRFAAALRAPDGIHLSASGSERLARQVLAVLNRSVPLPRSLVGRGGGADARG